ncbi:MAG TPA: MarR family transcriptional regulator [Solirubrobacteraceae bacterium]|jgi:DNA-binding MarR family transcriptional regulator
MCIEGHDHTAARDDPLVDAILSASRALIAVAARSLATADGDVTWAQYRVLVELAERGPQRLADLAAALAVGRSTATRMADRLAHKQLVHRRRITSDRRGVRVSLTASGRDLVHEVGRRRRTEISNIVQRMEQTEARAAVEALQAFAEATGEVPERSWPLRSEPVR